jgi:hypothetical protein
MKLQWQASRSTTGDRLVGTITLIDSDDISVISTRFFGVWTR